MKEVSEQISYYNPIKNDELKRHLGRCLKERIDPSFRGYKFYRRLCKKGYLIPDRSFIEVMHDSGLVGKRYLVRADYRLMSGDGRLYNPVNILREDRVWEARHLARPIKRVGESSRF